MFHNRSIIGLLLLTLNKKGDGKIFHLYKIYWKFDTRGLKITNRLNKASYNSNPHIAAEAVLHILLLTTNTKKPLSLASMQTVILKFLGKKKTPSCAPHKV